MITGDTAPHVLYLMTTAGVAQSYANAAAFTGAGWALTWYDGDGDALVSQPAYTITDLGSGVHIVSYPVPAGATVAVPTVPAGMMDPGAWGVEGTSYDEDSLAGLLLASSGTVTAVSAADSELGDVVDGDSWSSGTLYMTLGKLSRFGLDYSDINDDDWTITAGVKSDPTDTTVELDAAFGASVSTDGAFSVSWDAFPTELALEGSEREKVWYLDVQIAEVASPNRVITVGRYTLNVKWDRDQPAAP